MTPRRSTGAKQPGPLSDHRLRLKFGEGALRGARENKTKKSREAGEPRPRQEGEVSVLQTIWSHLTFSDKAMIAANLVVACIFFVSWRRKKRRLAQQAKNDG
jgi:hypothetical protein